MTPGEARAVINSLAEAFLTADAEAVLAMFAADGDVIYAGSEVGEVAVGRPALRRLLHLVFARDERYSWTCDSVQVVPGRFGVAVLAEATLSVHPLSRSVRDQGSRGLKVESLPYRVSGVLEEEAGDWRWRFCHGSEPAGHL